MRYFYYKLGYGRHSDWVAWKEWGEVYEDTDEIKKTRTENILYRNTPWTDYCPDFRVGKKEFKSKEELVKFVWLMHPEKFT